MHHKQFLSALANPGYRKNFTEEGYLVPQPHADTIFDQAIAANRGRWATLIKTRNISLE